MPPVCDDRLERSNCNVQLIYETALDPRLVPRGPAGCSVGFEGDVVPHDYPRPAHTTTTSPYIYEGRLDILTQ